MNAKRQVLREPALGLDFGTTNTVIAASDGTGTVAPVRFAHGDESLSTFASALCFWEEDEGRTMRLRAAAGPWAIDQFLIDPPDCRFLQSLKSFAASRLFEGTAIFDRFFRFEELLGAFFERLRDHSAGALADSGRRIVIGRPVQYVGSNPDATLAMKRYLGALASIGFHDVHFVYEPVAAAFFYARRLEADATVLVADFGGGTTDYSIMRFTVGDRQRNGERSIRARAIANAGAGVAGDRFDYRIIDKVVSPLLGKGTLFGSEGKLLEMPDSCYASFASWHLLSVLSTSREFREFRQLITWAKQPELLERMVRLIESGRSFSLYQSVARVKAALSSSDSATLEFDTPELQLSAPIARADFEHWIADDLAVIERALDEALARARLGPNDISKVFLTGGTSFVPAVRQMFIERFGQEKIESGDEFESIANGLALIGQREDIEQWTVPVGAGR